MRSFPYTRKHPTPSLLRCLAAFIHDRTFFTLQSAPMPVEPKLRHVSDCLLVVQNKFNAIEQNKRLGVGLKFQEQLDFDPWMVKTALQNLCRQAERICSRSSPILSVPEDVLFILFDCVREGWPSSHQTSRRSWQKAVLHTCRSWRETAMRHARLWTDISLNVHRSRNGEDAKAQFALSHSGQVPLQLHIKGETGRTSLSTLGEHFLKNVISRAADLHFTGHLGDKALKILSSVQCSRLRTLTVDAKFHEVLLTGDTTDDEDPDRSKMRVFPKLFQGQFSSLLSLSIVMLHKYDTGNTFEQLTQLRLSRQWYRGPVAINGLLDLLGSVPTLEDLEFQHVKVKVRALPEVDSRVVLPSLQRLVFSDVSLADCRYLMSLLECSNKELALTCICNKSGVDEEGPVLIDHIMSKDALSAAFTTLANFPKAKLSIADDTFIVSAVNSVSGMHIGLRENAILREFGELLVHPNFARHPRPLHFLSPVTELWLQVEGGLPKVDWQRVLTYILISAPHVQKLILKFTHPAIYRETFKVLNKVLPARLLGCEVHIVGLWAVDPSKIDSQFLKLSEASTVSIHIYGGPSEAQRKRWLKQMDSWESHGVQMVANAHPFHMSQLPRVCREETKGIWSWATFGGYDWVNC